jgi:hypothetical protein
MPRDYYITLGMHRDASAEEIVEAYRELVREYHPDLNAADPEAEKRFEEVQSAFEVLSDPKRRTAYNRTDLSFTTTRYSAGRRADDTQFAARDLTAVQRQSHRRPQVFAVVIAVTIVWLIVMPRGIALLAPAYSSGRELSKFLWYRGYPLLICGTLVYSIVMFVLVRGHFPRALEAIAWLMFMAVTTMLVAMIQIWGILNF